MNIIVAIGRRRRRRRKRNPKNGSHVVLKDWINVGKIKLFFVEKEKLTILIELINCYFKIC